MKSLLWLCFTCCLLMYGNQIHAEINAPTNTFSLTHDQNTCVMFKAGITFSIPYSGSKQNTTKTVALPANFTVDGTCNMTGTDYYTQQIVVTFYDIWNLTIDFTSDVKSSEATKPKKYYVSKVMLDYEINKPLFNDAKPTEVGRKGSVQSNNFSSNYLTASASKSYLCESDITVVIKDIRMTTRDLQYQAFKTGNATTFSDASECSADITSDSVVPIAVGSSLAALVIIVLVIYLIGRKRSRSGYD